MSAAAAACGFADEATATVALAWSLPGSEGGMIVREGETLAAEAAIAGDGDATRLTLHAEGVECEAVLKARPGLLPLPAAPVEIGLGEPSGAACTVRATIRDGAERRLDCEGYVARWASDPTEGASVFRFLALPGPDRSLLLAAAARPDGAETHGDEGVAAWQLDPEGEANAFGEALLSTQYDGDGVQVRAGLELWRQQPDSPPLRAAGRLLHRTVVELGPVTAATLHTSAEGSEGIGGYLIWRR
jgi:hypothetical protein